MCPAQVLTQECHFLLNLSLLGHSALVCQLHQKMPARLAAPDPGSWAQSQLFFLCCPSSSVSSVSMVFVSKCLLLMASAAAELGLVSKSLFFSELPGLGLMSSCYVDTPTRSSHSLSIHTPISLSLSFCPMQGFWFYFASFVLLSTVHGDSIKSAAPMVNLRVMVHFPSLYDALLVSSM